MLFEAIAGTNNIDDRSFAAPSPSNLPACTSIERLPLEKSLAGKRIGVITESLKTPATDPRVVKTFNTAVQQFIELGATVEQVSIPIHSRGAAIWTGISKVGGALAKTSGSFGRRAHQMLGLNALFNGMKQENWDEAYASTKNVFLNGLYAVEKFPLLLSKATNLSR